MPEDVDTQETEPRQPSAKGRQAGGKLGGVSSWVQSHPWQTFVVAGAVIIIGLIVYIRSKGAPTAAAAPAQPATNPQDQMVPATTTDQTGNQIPITPPPGWWFIAPMPPGDGTGGTTQPIGNPLPPAPQPMPPPAPQPMPPGLPPQAPPVPVGPAPMPGAPGNNPWTGGLKQPPRIEPIPVPVSPMPKPGIIVLPPEPPPAPFSTPARTPTQPLANPIVTSPGGKFTYAYAVGGYTAPRRGSTVSIPASYTPPPDLYQSFPTPVTDPTQALNALGYLMPASVYAQINAASHIEYPGYSIPSLPGYAPPPQTDLPFPSVGSAYTAESLRLANQAGLTGHTAVSLAREYQKAGDLSTSTDVGVHLRRALSTDQVPTFAGRRLTEKG